MAPPRNSENEQNLIDPSHNLFLIWRLLTVFSRSSLAKKVDRPVSDMPENGSTSDETDKMKKILVGGPLLGSRQRNIPSDFNAWDQFEPLITPDVQLGKQSQRFILLPHSDYITVLAYNTGFRIATFVPVMEDEKQKNSSVIIESVCLAKHVRKIAETTVQDVLEKMAVEGDSDEDEEASLDQTVEEVLVLAGCRDGTIREFSLNSLEHTADSSVLKCGSYHIRGPCYRPRRVIRLGRKEPVMHITVPPIGHFTQDGILVYMALRTKGLEKSEAREKKSDKANTLSMSIIKILLPHFSGSPEISLTRKEKEDSQRVWQLDKFKCRVGKDKVGGFMNTIPFRLVSAAKPFGSDRSIFLVLARANSIHVYYDQVKSTDRYAPMSFPMPSDNPISALHISVNNADIACGHYFGQITVMNDVLTRVEKFHASKTSGKLNTSLGKAEDPRSNIITSKVHWHSHPVSSLIYDSTSSIIDPILYSGGEESVLVTWNVSKGRSKPSDILPRVALGSIVHLACADRVDNNPTSGILVYCEDNSLQLIESHSKSQLWKLQGLACERYGTNHDLVARGTRLEVDPLAKGDKTSQLVITGLRAAPGYMHWFDNSRQRLSASLEIAAFNRVSKTEADENPMPIPFISNHAFSEDGSDLVTLDESPTENVFVGAYDDQGKDGSYGLVTTIRFWTHDSQGDISKDHSFSKAPYRVTAAMTYPHGPKNRISALAVTKDGSMACSVSNEEKAFRVWQKVIQEDSEDTRRTPSWTCRYKVTIPAGFSNFATRRDAVAFSDDGSVLAIAFGNTVTFWDSDESRFLHSVRHLEGSQGTIDSMKFCKPGRLQDVILIMSEYGVSLLSPFGGRGGFEGWSWGIPIGIKNMIITAAEVVESHACVAIAVLNRTTGLSRVVLISASTGRPGVGSDDLSLISDIRGHIVSLSAVGKSKTCTNWSNKASDASDTSLQIYGLTADGHLLLLTNESEEATTMRTVWQGKSVSRAPTLDIGQIASQNPKRRQRSNSVSQSEPTAKKSAVEVFGLTTSGEDKASQAATSELPKLTKNFVRAFVGRSLLRSTND